MKKVKLNPYLALSATLVATAVMPAEVFADEINTSAIEAQVGKIWDLVCTKGVKLGSGLSMLQGVWAGSTSAHGWKAGVPGVVTSGVIYMVPNIFNALQGLAG